MPGAAVSAESAILLPPDLPLEEAERRYARATLASNNQSAAARALGISRNKLTRLLRGCPPRSTRAGEPGAAQPPVLRTARLPCPRVVRSQSMVVVLPSLTFEEDQHVVLRAMAWQDFEALLATRGDRSGVRMYYLDGEIEIVSPTKIHEGRKKTLARLLEFWAMESDLSLNGFGSWTLKKELREAGAEPDECYIVGNATEKNVPDLAIEVEWSRTGLSKPEIYRRIGVRELWTLKSDGQLVVRIPEKGAWTEHTRSRLFPKLDLAWLQSFLEITPQSRAVRALRDALRTKKRRS